ncbi:serine hydrolase domain-containing protein [Paludisphaera rhizosphaerae]|uniref:serine hydrolase domain-containing protein n=1 Tax=Paludisphaera rhizosphaerae TaxID=2711216 RepID=UPI001F0D1798|nr:serine hydrolase domain-containing protein [Paludisphaera rhizosphaerae]
MNRRTIAPVLLAFALASVVSSAGAQTPAPSVSVVESVDAYMREAMAKRHVPGASVAVVKDGKVLLSKGYGLANVELGVPATDQTVYQLASVTKTFTATAVMLLVGDGKLKLDDKISDRLKDLPAAWKDVTVRQLLTHTSGIKSYTSVKDFDKMTRKDFAPREILDLVAKEPLEFPSGEKWQYSNTGYFLLGMIVEQASGKPFGEFLAERIFRPLGMTKTRVNDLRAVIPGRAQGYEWDGKELKNGEYVSPTQPFSAGALVSTVADLVKWDAALAGGKILDGPTLEKMWKPTPLKEGEASYGFGWGVTKVAGHREVAHGGGIPGFSTEIARFLDDRLTIIVLTNLEGGHAGEMARKIAGLVVPALVEKPLEPIADADEAATKRLRGVLEAAVKGEADPDLFAEAAKTALVPRIKETAGKLPDFGALKAFQLVERKEVGETLRLRYRAAFANETVRASFVLDKAGKVAGLMIQPGE